MEQQKIIISAKRKMLLQHLRPGKIGMVKITPEAYNILVDMANDSGMTLSNIASSIIIQAASKGLIQFDIREEENN